jgi:putative acetyltransferase
VTSEEGTRVHIEVDDSTRADVLELLTEHLADMYATSPPESVHALDPAALTAPAITFWTARLDGALLGCGALKELEPSHGEIKSMRTGHAARGRGVATAILGHILRTAAARGYRRLSWRPARRSSSSRPAGSTSGTASPSAPRSATTRRTTTASS